MKNTSLILFVLLVLALAGCGQATMTPHDRLAHATDAFARAVVDRNADAVYDLLQDDMKRHFTRAEFRPFFDNNLPDFDEYASKMTAGAQHARIEAYLGDDPHAKTRLIWRSGKWQFDGNPDARQRRTPDDLKNQLKDDALRDIPNFEKAVPPFDAHSQANFRALLSQAATENITILGTEARIALDKRNIIYLEATNGRWRLRGCLSLP
ncbi:MAG: hypothetical protein FWC40_08270 [Proteobacteria bacterium]|nr:hypothetical protein [Pseudomonadota bacterium]